jgi:hypothetical protein
VEEFGVRGSGWSGLPRSDAAWDEGAARAALDSWAGDDIAKYGHGFLWSDGTGNKTGFKFPIAMPVGGKLTVFNRAVAAAKGRLNQADIPDAAKASIGRVLNDLSGTSEMSLVAASVPTNPPKAWFGNPGLTGKTKITVTPEGRVFGHLAPWDTCHMTFANVCVTVPKSKRKYADFHVGSTRTAEGDTLDTGVITVDTGHASETFTSAAKVKAHYDDTGTAAAVVRAGEDAYGVWIAGSLVPGADEELAQKVRRAPLSGDWRRIAGNLELVAALGVNRPAFAVTASGEPVDDDEGAFVNIEDGEITCLVASATFFEAEEFDVNVVEENAGEDFSDVAVDDDCGCPDRIKGYSTLLTDDELAAREAKLAAYAML